MSTSKNGDRSEPSLAVPDGSDPRGSAAPKSRATYRHGDLKRALVEAGVALARQGGPEAVVLREATRRAGVVPNAAYRHFASRQELLMAVRSAALSAMALAMEEELARVPASGGEAMLARLGLRAIGTAYLSFAQREIGLFRTAFVASDASQIARDTTKSGRSGLDPFELLSAALDRLVAAGVLPAERRAGAEYLAWSAVHGLATLITDGPLHGMAAEQADAIGRRVLDLVEKGL